MKFSRLGVLILLLLAVPVVAQSQRSELKPPSGPQREALLRRWESMDDAERELYRERFDQLRRLDAEARGHLEERAKALEAEIEAMRGELPRDLEAKLRGLQPRERDAILREFVTQRDRVRGARVKERLPREFVTELEGAPPARRRGMVRRFREQMRREAEGRVLSALDVSEDELRELEGLRGRDRSRCLLEMKRQHIRGRVGRHGPPPDLEQSRWSELDQLPVEEFFDRWHQRRPRRGLANDEGPEVPRHADQNPWMHRGQVLDELAERAHPTLEDLVDLAALPPRERDERVAGLVRERCLTLLEEFPLLPADELQRLRERRGADFLEAMRRHIGDLVRKREGDRGPWRQGGARGPRGERGGPPPGGEEGQRGGPPRRRNGDGGQRGPGLRREAHGPGRERRAAPPDRRL